MVKRVFFLLPRSVRPVGFLLAALGLVILILRFSFGLKPAFLETKVFAFYSKYLGTKIMQPVRNQLFEELGGILAFSGLFMAAFSRERTENETVDRLRLKAFFITAYAGALFFILAMVFTYGLGFIYMMMLYSAFWIIVYMVSFRLLYRRYEKNSRS